MLYYRAVLEMLEKYFHCSGWKKLFLNGGCYWLADFLHQGICDSVIMINRLEEHCALYFNNGLYDVCGRISSRNFRIAGERDISFMKKNYIPSFSVKELEEYLAKMLSQEVFRQ